MLINVKRKAFVGFSTPFGYDYKVKTGFNKGNPILEAPTGLLILYDEIWFAHEDVCPLNLRDKEFVHFLQDIKTEPEIDKDILKMLSNIKYNQFKWDWKLWKKIVETNTVRTEGVDQHHRNIVLGEISTIPRPDSPLNYILDCNLAILNKMDFVTNSVTTNAIGPRLSTVLNRPKAGQFVENLIAKRIPCFQTEEGPYIEYIDDLRKSPYIRDFRKKIDDELLKNSSKTSIQLAQETEEEFKQFSNSCIKHKINKKRIFYSSLKEYGLSTFSKIYPIIQLLKIPIKGYETINDYRTADKYQWTGFITDIDLYKEKITKLNHKT